MASQLARENTRFYVGRYEIKEPKNEQVVHFDEYRRTFTPTEDFSRSDGFVESRTASRIANRLNLIEGHVSDEREEEPKYHYFTYKKDDQVTTLGNYDLPEEVEEELEDEEESEEEDENEEDEE